MPSRGGFVAAWRMNHDLGLRMHVLCAHVSAHLAIILQHRFQWPRPDLFQMLHVKVVEARGLMARDGLLGRSDPYVKLDLTGRCALCLERNSWRRGELLQTPGFLRSQKGISNTNLRKPLIHLSLVCTGWRNHVTLEVTIRSLTFTCS